MLVRRRRDKDRKAYTNAQRERDERRELATNRQTTRETLSLALPVPLKTQRQVLVSGTVWLLCIRRVRAMRAQIHEHMHMETWATQERGEELERRGAGGGLINAVSDPELEGRRRGSAVV